MLLNREPKDVKASVLTALPIRLRPAKTTNMWPAGVPSDNDVAPAGIDRQKPNYQFNTRYSK
jgi:hypothetical protein